MANASITKPEYVIDGPLPTCRGYQQLDTTTLSASSSLTVPNNASIAVFQAEGAAVRWRADGVAPTATVGMLLNANTETVYPASDSALAQLKFIRTAAGAILNVHYY